MIIFTYLTLESKISQVQSKLFKHLLLLFLATIFLRFVVNIFGEYCKTFCLLRAPAGITSTEKRSFSFQILPLTRYDLVKLAERYVMKNKDVYH